MIQGIWLAWLFYFSSTIFNYNIIVKPAGNS